MAAEVKIALAAPIRPSAQSGNDATAQRWAERLRSLGHRVTLVPVHEEASALSLQAVDDLRSAEVLVALHARRSARAVAWWTEHRGPAAPLIVALAGTDLYVDLPDSDVARRSVHRAHALVVLQHAAVQRLRGFEPAWASKTKVIYQSVDRPLPIRNVNRDEFRVVVLAHLRPVKAPLLSARAARLLGPSSRVVVHHGGRAHDEEWQRQALNEESTNGRYVWHRELSAADSLELLATAQVLACTSVSEGGANVVTEALALGVPVIGTRIDGNVGILGDDYPGLVPVGDHVALSNLLAALEEPESALLDELQERTSGLQVLTEPATEVAAWAELIASIS